MDRYFIVPIDCGIVSNKYNALLDLSRYRNRFFFCNVFPLFMATCRPRLMAYGGNCRLLAVSGCGIHMLLTIGLFQWLMGHRNRPAAGRIHGPHWGRHEFKSGTRPPHIRVWRVRCLGQGRVSHISLCLRRQCNRHTVPLLVMGSARRQVQANVPWTRIRHQRGHILPQRFWICHGQ